MHMKIYVYGTGCGAGDLTDAALPAERVEAFVEQEGGGSFLGRPVITLEELAGRELDLLIVAGREAERVERDCQRLGIAPEKLLFLKNHLAPVERNRSYDMARAVLGDAFVDRLIGSERLIRVPLWTETEHIAGPGSDNDYVRLKTLEALCLRLDGVPGAAAELGVYRGGFARWINALLPDRRFFLFDTFEGFDPAESAGEGKGFTEAHRNTRVEEVLAALPHAGQAVIRRGLFPQTAEGLEEERFALVSLDADLEESTLAGLRFFWPRMSAGGYLLLHDYNNPKLPGVRRALERFEAERGRLAAVPLCDVNGTLVIPN
jgi:hypothetical protein